MVKRIHEIRISVFVKPEEDIEKIAPALKQLTPFDLEKEKILFSDTVTISFNDRKIHILEIRLNKERHTNKFINHLREALSKEQIRTIHDQVESRLDEELSFFVRIGKDEWLDDRELVLTDGGNCFHIRMHLAAFPAKREKGLEIARSLFDTD